jgi:hypothetical protein
LWPLSASAVARVNVADRAATSAGSRHANQSDSDSVIRGNACQFHNHLVDRGVPAWQPISYAPGALGETGAKLRVAHDLR